MSVNVRSHGHVLVGLWMSSPAEVAIMLRAIEGRLRSIGPDDADRPRLEKWRTEALNFPSRADRDDWVGWDEGAAP